MKKMKSLSWLILGTPFWAVWLNGGNSCAGEVLVSFEVVPLDETLPTVPDMKAEAVVEAPAADDGYLLNFKPPPLASDESPLTQSRYPSSVLASPPKAVSSADIEAPPAALRTPPVPVPPIAETPTPLPLPPLTPDVAALFAGDDNSLVAIAIGHAEGTRTATGDRTLAYFGHVDPGNQAWNQGTFSYQHDARSPAEADQKQLEQLKHQSKKLHQLAFQRGLVLTQEEFLNGIDLANQAPAAALDRGYLDWLMEARNMGLRGEEAIVWARTRSFLDPDTAHWNAPGLGNSVQSITMDQARRQHAIAQVMATHASQFSPVLPNDSLPQETSAKPTNIEIEKEEIDFILTMDMQSQ